MLVREFVSQRKEIKETLHEVESILKCLNEEDNSIVIDAFVYVENELKKEMLLIQDEGSDIVLHQVLELQVNDIWNKLELNPGAPSAT